ncbi:hypothetical protein CT0861_00026, partial [Colletotrichum tofieldiae]
LSKCSAASSSNSSPRTSPATLRNTRKDTMDPTANTTSAPTPSPASTSPIIALAPGPRTKTSSRSQKAAVSAFREAGLPPARLRGRLSWLARASCEGRGGTGWMRGVDNGYPRAAEHPGAALQGAHRQMISGTHGRGGGMMGLHGTKRHGELIGQFRLYWKCQSLA